MIILALDSCGAGCGAGVFKDGKKLAKICENMERGQDARLLPLVVAVMEKAGVEFQELDRVAVTRGPGSFTGTRVGLAAAHGIGIAANKPVIGIDRFAIYRSLGATANRDLLVVIDSKRAELFCKFFPVKGEAQEARLMTQQDIDTFIAQHPGTEIAGDMTTPDDDVLAACARLAAGADAKNPDYAAKPLYLREADVSFAKAR